MNLTKIITGCFYVSGICALTSFGLGVASVVTERRRRIETPKNNSALREAMLKMLPENLDVKFGKAP